MGLSVRLLRLSAILAGVSLAICASSAQASRHRALIIGNNYPNLSVGKGRLENAHADADSVDKLLRRIGFGEGDPSAISVKKDASLNDIYDLWQRTLEEADSEGIVVFFFSGHGFQERHSNYLLQDGAPIVPSTNPKVLETQYVRLDAIMEAFLEIRQNKDIVGLFIIDACREDVFKPAGTRAIGGARGLAPVRMPSDSETFVLFATAPGQYAYDGLQGEGVKGSVFTRNFVSELETKQRMQVEKEGLTDIAQDVRDLVVALARKHSLSQVPTYYDQLAQRRNIFGGALPRRTQAEEMEQLQKPLAMASATPAAFSSATRTGGDAFSDTCPDCPQMVVISAGQFLQGSPDTERGHARSEGPQRVVALKVDFAISKFPITNQQWNLCVKDGG